MEELRQDVKEIKHLTLDLVKQGAMHNEILRTHEARSIALQAAQEKTQVELEPLKTHVKFVDLLLKGAGVILLGTLGQWIWKVWF